MGATALGLRYPAATNAVDVPTDIQNLANDAQGLFALLVNKPRFSLYQNAAPQNVLNATWTSITMNAETYDTANGHDNVTNNSRYTVQAGHGGLWLLTGKHAWDANTAGRRLARWLVNGASVIDGSEMSAPPAASVTTGIPMVCVLWIAVAGDYVEMQLNQDSGGTRTTLNGSSTTGSFMSGVRIGS